MRWTSKIPFQLSRKSLCQSGFRFAAALGLALSMHPAVLTAQQLPPLTVPGDAAVTGFSGALPPAQIAPGDQAAGSGRDATSVGSGRAVVWGSR